jgi:hypothetical protein
MLIHGFPLAAHLPSDPSLQERFWYWQGSSGRRYIHSVYAPDECPPLPGAVFVGVRRDGPMRVAVLVGRFTPFYDGTLAFHDLEQLRAAGVDEVHVHLLAKSPEAAQAILDDLTEAMMGVASERGFSEAETEMAYAA